MKITFAEPKLPALGALGFLIGSDGELGARARTFDQKTKGAVSRAMKARSFAGKSGETVSILGPAGAEDNTFLLVGAGAAKDFDASRAQAAGAAISRALGALSITEAAVVADAPTAHDTKRLGSGTGGAGRGKQGVGRVN